MDFYNAQSLEDALKTLREKRENALVIAGGSGLMVELNGGLHAGKTLVNIRELTALKGIYEKDGRVYIGALATASEIAASTLVQESAAALFMAASVFADGLTRNTATLGGNAASGSPAADFIPALMVLDAEVELASISGKRSLPIEAFYMGFEKTARAADELITGFSFGPAKSAFYKLGARNAMAISIATAAAAVETDVNGKVTLCRIALGALAPTVMRAKNAERVVTGSVLDDTTLTAMEEAVQQDISPLSDLRASAAYRRSAAPALIKRALKKAAYGCCGHEENDIWEN